MLSAVRGTKPYQKSEKERLFQLGVGDTKPGLVLKGLGFIYTKSGLGKSGLVEVKDRRQKGTGQKGKVRFQHQVLES